MWKIYSSILLLTLLHSTIDVYSKKGGSAPGASSSRGTSILSKLKNTFSNRGHQATGLRKPAAPPRPLPNFQNKPGRTSWKAPAVGVGAGALGGYAGHSWARNAGHTRYSGLSSGKKAALAGTLGALAGGYVGYKVGKAMNRHHAYYQGRNYWYGSRYYSPTGGRKTCIFEVDSSAPNWNYRYEDDNTAVKEVIFECMPHEQCCELSCCRTPTYIRSSSHRGWHWWHTLSFLACLVILQEIIMGNFWDLLAMPAWLLMTSATLFVGCSFFHCTIVRNYFLVIFDPNGALLLFVLGIILAVCAFGATKALESRRENSAPIAMATYDDDESRKPFNPPDQYSGYPPAYPATYPAQPAGYPTYPAAYPQQPPAYYAAR